uniref:Cwf19-like C-terminal domain-containing protein n=1 Tax=Strigamia maritima TaxID=126957 RepID=T1JI23_STRMM
MAEVKYRKPKHKKSQDSQSSSDECIDWVEAASKAAEVLEKPKVNRDEWMSLSAGFCPTVSRSEVRKSKHTEAKEKEKQDRLQLDNPGQHERELNPYWRDGGKGIPTESENSKSKEASSFSSGVGDKGLSWITRAYQRAKEQAKEEGRSLEDVAAERWGSLQKLENLIEDAKNRARGPSKSTFEREKFYEERRARHPERRRNKDDRRRYDDDRRRDDNDRKSSSRNFYKPEPHDGENSSESPNKRDERNRRRNDNDRKSYSKSFYKPESHDGEKSPVPPRRRDEWNRRESGWKAKSDKKSHEKHETQVAKEHFDEPMDVEPTTTQENVPNSPPSKLSDEEMNKLGAKIIKAEILGDSELVNKLRQQLKEAQMDRQFGSESNRGLEEKTVIINKHGGQQKNKRSKVQTHDEEGKRTRYFADDDQYSLKQMFEREKRNTVEDENILFSKMVSKGKDLDGDVDYVGRLTEEGAQHSKAVNELKSSSIRDACPHCYGTVSFAKHLVVATGTKVYVCVPQHVSLQEGHCFIVPMQHAIAATQIDEDVWEEIQDFRKALTKMFEKSDLDVVFFENSRNLRSFPHMYLECVPLPRDAGDTAPIYFKKALLECETEWSHNKKVVDLSQKDVRKAVPKGLPYFAVDFGLQGGFAHVIEDEKLFPRNFAQEIIGGILDLEPRMWRKPSIESFEDQQSKRFDLIKQFKTFDWSKA